MSNSVKKLLALTLSVLFLLAFVACGNTDTDGSAIPNDQTQDFEEESFWEDEYTDEEKEQIEDLWNDGVNSGSGEITENSSKVESSSPSNTTGSSQSNASTGSSSSVSNSSATDSSASSSEVSSSNNSVSSDAASSEVSSEETSSSPELAPEISDNQPNGIF